MVKSWRAGEDIAPSSNSGAVSTDGSGAGVGAGVGACSTGTGAVGACSLRLRSSFIALRSEMCSRPAPSIPRLSPGFSSKVLLISLSRASSSSLDKFLISLPLVPLPAACSIYSGELMS